LDQSEFENAVLVGQTTLEIDEIGCDVELVIFRAKPYGHRPFPPWKKAGMDTCVAVSSLQQLGIELG
jgi:hypothetical protein